MKTKSEKGAVVLIMTSLLILAALILSLGTYKSTFYQIKRAQNEVLAKQGHWRAEGAIECLFTFISETKTEPSLLSKNNSSTEYSDLKSACDITYPLENLYAKTISSASSTISYQLTYELNNEELIKKNIIPKITYGNGAIQARGNLIIDGSLNVYPDVTGDKIDDKDKCVAIKYTGAIDYRFSGSGLKTLNPEDNGPYDGYKGTCHASTKSNINISSKTDDPATSSNFLSDYIKENHYDPFEAFFQKPRSKLAEVKNEYTVISGSKLNCDDLIANAFTSSDKVWVLGNCDLGDGHSLTSLPQTPRNLVIEGGVLGIYSAVNFYGSVYHMYHHSPGLDLTTNWDGMVSANTLSSDDKKTVSHFQAGAFVPTGGLILDTPNSSTLLRGSIIFKYKRTARKEEYNNFTWQKGSWNDL
ncbi:hypothetical protein [Aliivibrio fischeri]|uniref:hypothetical protein n=1 Tax=Aliivibrio fischeri TaxID=668 RepID=UPI0007C42E64|nr:hypothetical protein [Aliivibrio fischeri]MCE7555729.1 hypothetical protein [Aliivibrio fischeri]MCE7563559.1 hypothetical protein [Aliivibrio fischeri]MCE7570664.1 hypothetical protein [Aliivibrio fischeri]